MTNAALQDSAGTDPCCSDGPRPALSLVPPLATVSPPRADSEAVAELWRRHGDALLRFALNLTRGDRQRAEDIVQETLLRAWRHPEVVGAGDRAIRGWLFTVTRHVAIDMWRVRSRADETIEDRPTDRPDPAQQIEHVVTALEVGGALAQLSLQHREVIVRMYFHGQSAVEIAESLQIPVGTVKSRTYYGLRQLRRLLSPESAGSAEGAGRRIPA